MKMKSMFLTLFVAVLPLQRQAALGQEPPAPALAAPDGATAGVVPTPGPDQPVQSAPTPLRPGFSGGFGARTAPVAAGNGYFHSASTGGFGYHAGSAGPATVIAFSSADPRNVDSLQEDLTVMSLVIQQKLEKGVGEGSPDYRMGIPLLLRSGQRGIESLYLEGFGAVFTLNVNFPLVPPPAAKAKEIENGTSSDEWDKARRELYGGRESRDAGNFYGSAGVPYDAEQVGALKRTLLEALKNAANIRGLKPEEAVVVTVIGNESVSPARAWSGGTGGGGVPDSSGGTAFKVTSGGTQTGPTVDITYTNVGTIFPVPAYRTAGGVIATGDPDTAYQRFVRGEWLASSGRGTVLTVRVRKSDAEAYAKGKLSFEQFQEKATVNSYLGAARSAAGLKGASYPAVYNPVPMAR